MFAGGIRPRRDGRAQGIPGDVPMRIQESSSAESSCSRRAGALDIDDLRRNMRWRLVLSLLAATLVVIAEVAALRTTAEADRRPPSARQPIGVPAFVTPLPHPTDHTVKPKSRLG